jgi:hypothetical protein
MVVRAKLGAVGAFAIVAALSSSCSLGDMTAHVGTPAPAATSEGPRSADEDYLTALGGSLPYTSRKIALTLGQRTCGAFLEGSSAADIRTVLVTKGLSPTQSNRVVLAAVATICPEYKAKAMG